MFVLTLVTHPYSLGTLEEAPSKHTRPIIFENVFLCRVMAVYSYSVTCKLIGMMLGKQGMSASFF